MTKKLIHTLIILNIIFFAISSYSLEIQTNKECQKKCRNVCGCEKDSSKFKNNDCSCATNHPPSLFYYLTYTKKQVNTEELESTIEPPTVLISILPFVYNRVERFSEREIFLYLYQVDCSPPF